LSTNQPTDFQARVLKASYFACIAIGEKPSVRNLSAMFKKVTGKGLRLEACRVWLCEWDTFGIQTGHISETPGETDVKRKIASPETDAETVTGNLHAGGINGMPLIELELEPSAPVKKPRRKSLPLPPSPTEIQAREILAVVLPRVAAAIAGTMTQATWRARQKRTALEMAEAGLTPERVAEAHANLCEERGEVIYTLRWVHDRMLRGDPKPKVDPRKNGCGCELDVSDCIRLHQDDYPIEPISEIIARQRAEGIYSGSIANPLPRSC
jgi:hypothetical protein